MFIKYYIYLFIINFLPTKYSKKNVINIFRFILYYKLLFILSSFKFTSFNIIFYIRVFKIYIINISTCYICPVKFTLSKFEPFKFAFSKSQYSKFTSVKLQFINITFFIEA